MKVSTDFPEPPSETAEPEEKDEEDGDSVEGGAAEKQPGPED